MRGTLLEFYREAKARLKDPVLARADIVEDPARSTAYTAARPGTDAAPAMSMGHVVLREFFVERTAADNIALASRLGWMPSYPTFDRNPLDLADEAEAAGVAAADHVVSELKSENLRFACEDPDAPENFPRCLTVWRADLRAALSRSSI